MLYINALYICISSLQGSLVYEIVADHTAQEFFAIDNQGVVTIKKDLSLDTFNDILYRVSYLVSTSLWLQCCMLKM